MNENNDIIWREEAGKGSDAMLTEERHEKIMRLVNTSGAVSVQDLVSFLNISESTVRRDLLTLDREGRLRRVHGGATTLRDDSLYEADMENLQDKYSIHMSEKRRIAQYAARLIHKEDFVYPMPVRRRNSSSSSWPVQKRHSLRTVSPWHRN